MCRDGEYNNRGRGRHRSRHRDRDRDRLLIITALQENYSCN